MTTNQNIVLYELATKHALQLKEVMPSLVLQANYTPNGTVLKTTRNNIRALSAFLRNNTATQASILVDIAATDKLSKTGRFSIKYSFLSVMYNRRLTVELFSDETLSIPSLAAPFVNQQKIFASAG